MAVEIGPALGLTADSKSLVVATEELRDLATAAKQAQGAAQQLAGGTDKATTAVGKAATATERQATSLTKANAAAAALARAEFARAQATLSAAKASGTATQADIEAARAAQQLARAQRDAANAAVAADRAMMAGTASIGQTAAAIDGLGQRSANTANVFANANDIVLMAVSGQSPLMLAMQQGTQLNQVWAQMGGNLKNIGSTLASSFAMLLNPINLATLGIIAGGAALVQWALSSGDAEDSAKTLADRMDELAEAQSRIEETREIATASTAQLIQDYGLLAWQVRDSAAALLELQQAQLEADLTASIRAANEELAAFAADFQGASARFAEAQAALDAAVANGIMDSAAAQNLEAARFELDFARLSVDGMAQSLGVTNEQAGFLAQRFFELQSASDLSSRVATLQAIQNYLRQAGINAATLPPELRAALSAANEFNIQAAGMASQVQIVKDWLDRAGQSLGALVGMTPSSGWLDGAIDGASRLAGALWDAAAAKSAATGMTMAPGSNWYAGMTPEDLLPGATGLVPSRNTGGDGGGGGTNQRQTQLEMLIDSLRTERETVEVWRAEQLELLAQYSDAELAAIGGANEAKLRLEEEYQERLRGIREGANGGALADAASFFGGMAEVARAGGEKTLKITQALAATQGVINSYLAFTEVLKDPAFIGRPWARAGAAAAALAQGLSAVASIRSASSGGARTGAGRGATASTAAAPSSPVSVAIQGLNPGDLYSGASVIGLVDAVQKELRNRGAIISFV